MKRTLSPAVLIIAIVLVLVIVGLIGWKATSVKSGKTDDVAPGPGGVPERQVTEPVEEAGDVAPPPGGSGL